MRSRSRLVWCMLTLLFSPSIGLGQYIFCDANGDGAGGESERLGRTTTSITIWLQTDQNRDGSRASMDLSETPRSIFSYGIALRSVGGTVSWGKWVNSQPSMSSCNFRRENDRELYILQCGMEALPPGKYELGQIQVTTLSGDPTIEFCTSSSLFPGGTSFGSMHPGRDIDHTLKLGDSEAPPGGGRGDFVDSDGVSARSKPIAAALIPYSRFFDARVVKGSSEGIVLRVTSTRAGFMEVRLFDLRGRLVSTPMPRNVVPEGSREVRLGTKHLASGIYFYRVLSAEGTKRGRVVVMH